MVSHVGKLFFIDKGGQEAPKALRPAWEDGEILSSAQPKSLPSWVRPSLGHFETSRILHKIHEIKDNVTIFHKIKSISSLNFGVQRLGHCDFLADLILFSDKMERKIYLARFEDSGIKALTSFSNRLGNIIKLHFFTTDDALIATESGLVLKWSRSLEPTVVVRINERIKWKTSCLSSCKKYFVMVGQRGRVIVFETLGWKTILDFRINGEANCCCLGSNGLLYVAGTSKRIFTWDIGTSQCISIIDDIGGGNITALALSHEERFLAVGCETGILNVYCLATKKLLWSLDQLVAEITYIDFEPSSKFLLFSSEKAKGSIRLVDISNGRVRTMSPTLSTWRIRQCQFVDSDILVVDIRGRIRFCTPDSPLSL